MTEKVQQVRSKQETPQWSLPDAQSTAEAAVHGAMDYCAQKMRLENSQAAVEYLRQQDIKACGYCQYSIAKQLGDSLGALDQNIRAVYILDFDATPQDICFADGKADMMIHLIVQVERKTRALDSLVIALDSALAQVMGQILGRGELQHVLDVQVVDDADVKGRVGYGAMLGSLHQRPIQLWKR